MGRLDGKTAIITGAASGMGAYEVALFAKEGAKVIATDVNYDALMTTVNKLGEHKNHIILLKHDVSNEDDWDEVISTSIKAYKKIDILVNNAGIVISNNVVDLSLEDWQKVMNININGVFLGMKKVIPQMIAVDGGSIINISSIYGQVGGSTSAAYSASKGAIKTLTKNAAADFGKNKIRVNTILPGQIATPMMEKQLNDPIRRSFIESNILLPNIGSVEDVAYGVLYLASDEAKFITGSDLYIDGGYTAK